MVSYKKKLKKKLKYRTLKYIYGGGIIKTQGEIGKSLSGMIKPPGILKPSPFMIFMKAIKNMMYYSLLSLATIPVYLTTVGLNFPLNSMRNMTNGRYKDTPFKDNALYKIAYKKIDNNKINLLKQEQEKGEIIIPEGTTFINGALYKGHVKGIEPQKEQNGGSSIDSFKNIIPTNSKSVVSSFKNMIPTNISKIKSKPENVVSTFKSNPENVVSTINSKPPENVVSTINSKPLANIVSTINSKPPENVVSTINSKPLANIVSTTNSNTIQLLNNKTIKRDPEQIKKIKEYYKLRITHKNKNRETLINTLKSNLLPNSQKSIEVLGRDYDTAGKNTMDTIYRMEMLDSQRIEDENSILKKAMKNLSSDILLKAIILFNTIFDTSYDPNDETSNNICASYLNEEKKNMGINDESETIPTFWDPIPVVEVKNVFKYKNGLSPLDFGSETFAKCLQSNLTKTEFSKEDIELCVDLIDKDCPDCTLNSTLTKIIESYGRLFTGKIDISGMINALFNILLKMYKNQIDRNTYKTDKEYEAELVTVYLTQINASSFDVKVFLEYANYQYVSGNTFNNFIGDIEIKMFKDIMCKYKLREKLFKLYNLKKQEEIEKLKKVSQNEREKIIKYELINFLDIFLDTSKLNLNNHLTIQEIETKIKSITITN
jgi:hypothetical protein